MQVMQVAARPPPAGGSLGHRGDPDPEGDQRERGGKELLHLDPLGSGRSSLAQLSFENLR